MDAPTTDKKSLRQKRIPFDPFYIRLAVAGLLAAAGTYFFVPYRGPVSTLFLIIVFAAVCAPLRLDWRIKAGLFALFGYFFHSAFERTVIPNLLFALACAVICALCCLCFALLRRKTVKDALAALLPVWLRSASRCSSPAARFPPFPPTKRCRIMSTPPMRRTSSTPPPYIMTGKAANIG